MSPERLGPNLLARLPAGVRRPGPRPAVGMAHVGAGAFFRCHQAEYTDDMLERQPGRWGIAGISIRPPRIAPTLGSQDGLYTRLCRSGDRVEARVIGCLRSVTDAQEDPAPALALLASPQIDVVTLTVTEKGYCHRPADGMLDEMHPDIAHDLAAPQAPRSLPGLLARALALRMAAGAGPVTFVSCDNLPENGVILGRAVRTLAVGHGPALSDWIAANAAFPSTMVDRIAPAPTPADRETVAERFGYRDDAVVVAEVFRQWVIADRFAGRRPPWDLAGAQFVADVTPFEQLKMRVLNAAQTTLAALGLLAGLELTHQAAADPLLATFARRMLLTESVPTLPPLAGVQPAAYVEQSLARIANTAIRHRNLQIATDGSQKIVQRLLNPARERLSRGEGAGLLAVAVAAWMACLVRAARRFGRAWEIDDPQAARVAVIADRIGRAPALAAEILALDRIFVPELAASDGFRRAVAAALDGFLTADPIAVVRRAVASPAPEIPA